MTNTLAQSARCSTEYSSTEKLDLPSPISAHRVSRCKYNLKPTQLQKQFPNLALKLSESQSGTDNQPIDASTSTTAIGIINKYIADIQTNVTMGDKSLEFWLNSCPEAYSQLSVLAVDLLAAPAS